MGLGKCRVWVRAFGSHRSPRSNTSVFVASWTSVISQLRNRAAANEWEARSVARNGS